MVTYVFPFVLESRLGGDSFIFDHFGRVSSPGNERNYILRPETVESYFYLWRLTHNPKYRTWGWQVVQVQV